MHGFAAILGEARQTGFRRSVTSGPSTQSGRFFTQQGDRLARRELAQRASFGDPLGSRLRERSSRALEHAFVALCGTENRPHEDLGGLVAERTSGPRRGVEKPIGAPRARSRRTSLA